jgi:hypothetical protein
MTMPEIIDKVLNMAIKATNAEREEMASVREDRGINARVFTVGGSRGGTPGNRYKRPRGKFQLRIEAPGLSAGLGRHKTRQE